MKLIKPTSDLLRSPLFNTCIFLIVKVLRSTTFFSKIFVVAALKITELYPHVWFNQQEDLVELVIVLLWHHIV